MAIYGAFTGQNAMSLMSHGHESHDSWGTSFAVDTGVSVILLAHM